MSDDAITLVVRRTIAASAERLFGAWTDPEQLRAWWGPADVVCTHAEVDARVGGRYRIGNTLADGNVVFIVGEFVAVEPPRRLVYTWSIEGEEAAPIERVTVRFDPRGEETEVIVLHERITDAPTRDAHRAGWEGCLDGLVAIHGAIGGD